MNKLTLNLTQSLSHSVKFFLTSRKLKSKVKMQEDIDTESIIQPLIRFTSSKHATAHSIPNQFKMILQKTEYMNNKSIAIYLAKTLQFMEKHHIKYNLNTSSLPQAVYHGVIHPSTIIRKFCTQYVEQSSISNLDDYNNIIQPLIHLIQQKLTFMDFTTDHKYFDQQQTKTSDSATTNDSHIVYVLIHLYQGLALLIKILSQDIINNHLLLPSFAGLWQCVARQVQMNQNDQFNDNEQICLWKCCCIFKRVLKCENKIFLFQHINGIIHNMDEMINTLYSWFISAFQFRSNKVHSMKDILNCLEVELIHSVYPCTLYPVWN